MESPPASDKSDPPDPGLYGRSFADTYDRWYGSLDDPGELVGACRDRLTEGARIVEMGAGTGRLAVPLSAAGFDVVSLDASVPMLMTNPTDWRVAADMAATPLRTESADAVIIAYNTLFNLSDPSSAITFFAQCAQVLRQGGWLGIEVFVAAPLVSGSSVNVAVRPTDANAQEPVLILTEETPDAAGGRRITGSHIEILPNQIVCRPWRLHYYSPAELDGLATTASFALSTRTADWGGTPYDESAPRHVSWYQREVELD